MPFASQPAAERVTGRDKRRIAAVAAALLLVLAAVAVWAAVRPGSYGSSKDGCITVTIPGSTGGQLIHQCGAGAALALQARLYRHEQDRDADPPAVPPGGHQSRASVVRILRQAHSS